MANVPDIANGGTEINAVSNSMTPRRNAPRARSAKPVARSAAAGPNESAQQSGVRDRTALRARKSAPLSERDDAKSASPTPAQELKRSPVNGIRPSHHRPRAAPAADQRTKPSKDPHLVPEDVKRRFVQVGNQYHFPDGARAFTDHGTRLTSPSENTEVIKSLISIAQARGWSDITVTGTERFRKEAWFAARLAGLEVRGYAPTQFEQERVVRTMARAQAPTGQRAAATPARNVERSSAVARETTSEAGGGLARERARTMHVGRLVDHGRAPYLHDPHHPMSYFVRVETAKGEREVWGVDLQRAMKESLTRPQIGDEVGLRALRRESVQVLRSEHDADGRVIGQKPHDAHRNAWRIEKHEFFRERAQAARVLRDASVDRASAVKQHPELLGTYLQLHAAELTAKRMGHPEDQRRFLASVRTALADSIARGEPLAPVPLKEPSEIRREPRARSAPAAPAVHSAPVR